MRLNLKDKAKKLNEAVRAQKEMADKLAVLEGKVLKDKNDTTKQSDIKKELKSTQDNLKCVINREKDLQEVINVKNKKIAELEAASTRLQLRREHAGEVIKNSDDKKVKTAIENSRSKTKCKF